MPDQVGSRQHVGDARKNVKEKDDPQKKMGWNRKAIVAPKFKGHIEELKGHVFDLHVLDQAEIFNGSIKEITEYVNQELNKLARKSLCNLKVPIIINPKKTELAQRESTMDNVDKAILQEKIREHVKEKRRQKRP